MSSARCAQRSSLTWALESGGGLPAAAAAGPGVLLAPDAGRQPVYTLPSSRSDADPAGRSEARLRRRPGTGARAGSVSGSSRGITKLVTHYDGQYGSSSPSNLQTYPALATCLQMARSLPWHRSRRQVGLPLLACGFRRPAGLCDRSRKGNHDEPNPTHRVHLAFLHDVNPFRGACWRRTK